MSAASPTSTAARTGTAEHTGSAEPTVAAQLAALAHSTTSSNLPARQAASVPQRVLDILGICVRSSALETSGAVRELVVDRGGRGDATAIGVPAKVPAASAALLNGTLAHSLDYDDTHLPSILHPSASVVPAALAAAEEHHRSGGELVSAIAAGLEVAVRVGMAGYDRRNRQNIWFDRGQHATSICGAIGSATAAAKLAGLDAAGIADAMGVATSMSSGIIEANRTGGTVKRIHCGWAAHAGVTAADLVRRGLSGPPTAFEGRFGLFEAFLGDRARPEEVLEGFAEDPATNQWCVADIFYKPYPANHYTHTGIDAAIELREAGLDPTEVASAHLGVASATVRTIGEPLANKRRPSTGYQAQFSGPFTVAAALLGGGGLGLGLGDFTDERTEDPSMLELMGRITVGADPACDEVYPDQFPAVLTVTTTDGRELRSAVMENRGGPERPLSAAELACKFTDNVAGMLDDAAVQQVLGAVEGLAGAGEAGALLDPLRVPI